MIVNGQKGRKEEEKRERGEGVWGLEIPRLFSPGLCSHLDQRSPEYITSAGYLCPRVCVNDPGDGGGGRGEGEENGRKRREKREEGRGR